MCPTFLPFYDSVLVLVLGLMNWGRIVLWWRHWLGPRTSDFSGSFVSVKIKNWIHSGFSLRVSKITNKGAKWFPGPLWPSSFSVMDYSKPQGAHLANLFMSLYFSAFKGLGGKGLRRDRIWFYARSEAERRLLLVSSPITLISFLKAPPYRCCPSGIPVSCYYSIVSHRFASVWHKTLPAPVN